MKEIFTRRSIRKFTAEPVSSEHIEKLLRAAMNAPSACNEQPWEFIVVRKKETMQKIRRYQHFSMPLDTANCAIIVCGDTRRQRYKGFWVQDCSAASQNILLEAHHLGLGAVWMGLHPIERWVSQTREVFSLPEEIVPMGIIALGHPDMEVKPADRYKSEYVHFEEW